MKIKLFASIVFSLSTLGYLTPSKAYSIDEIDIYSYEDSSNIYNDVWASEVPNDDLEMKIAVSKAWIKYAQEVDALYGYYVDYSIDEDGNVWEQHSETMRLSER